MRKIILLFILVCFSLIADENNVNVTQDLQQNLVYARYEQKPQRVYVNQIFQVKIKLIVAIKNFDKIITSFSDAKSCQVLNPDNSWKWYNDNIYYNTFYYKALSKDAIFPTVNISVSQNDKIISSFAITPIKSKIIKLQNNPLFSKVVAKELKIIKSKTTKFNDKSNIIVLEIDGSYANLRDFNMSNVVKNGIDSYNINLPEIKIFYFAIIPQDMKTFDFTYFNTTTNSFDKLSIPIELNNENISTQLELNPKNSKLSLYKNVILAVVAFVFFIIFLFRKKIIYIIVTIIIIVYLFIFYNPFDNIVLNKNTKIRILPTYNSTIFYITDRKIVAEKLNSVKDYIKVQLPNGKIGWIKKENK